MHKGEYIGKCFEEQKTKILILGESHHGDENEIGKPRENRLTVDVVNDYLNAKKGDMDRAWYFFTKIAHAFYESFDRSQTIKFWEKVAFGNYVDVCCGVKDKTAKKFIHEMKDIYNHELFQFVNKNSIDVVLCFSKLVFGSLPETSIPIEEMDPRIKIRYYAANEYSLNKELRIYGIPHPSGYGFKPKEYNNALRDLLRDLFPDIQF